MNRRALEIAVLCLWVGIGCIAAAGSNGGLLALAGRGSQTALPSSTAGRAIVTETVGTTTTVTSYATAVVGVNGVMQAISLCNLVPPGGLPNSTRAAGTLTVVRPGGSCPAAGGWADRTARTVHVVSTVTATVAVTSSPTSLVVVAVPLQTVYSAAAGVAAVTVTDRVVVTEYGQGSTIASSTTTTTLQSRTATSSSKVSKRTVIETVTLTITEGTSFTATDLMTASIRTVR